MAEYYRFFNSSEGDVREYQAGEFAEYFNRFLSDGVYIDTNNISLKVTPGAGLSINVATGYGFVKGYMYKNDDVLNKTLDPADSILERIDRIVLKFDEVNKFIKIEVKKGTFESSPVPPTLVITDSLKELSLAQIRIRKGATSILATDIKDERLTEFFGPVSAIITMPVEELWEAWNGELSNIQEAWDLIATNWQAWFGSVQNTLGLRVMVGEIEPLELATGDIWLKLANGGVEMYQKQSDGSLTLFDLAYTKMEDSRVITSPFDADINLMNNGDIWIKYGGI